MDSVETPKVESANHANRPDEKDIKLKFKWGGPKKTLTASTPLVDDAAPLNWGMFTTPELPPSRPPLDRSGWFSGGLAMEGELLKQKKAYRLEPSLFRHFKRSEFALHL